MEFERGYPERGRELAERAMEVVDDNGMHAMQQASLAFTALGQAQAAAGNVMEAMATLDRGLALRPQESRLESMADDSPSARDGSRRPGGPTAAPVPRAAR